MVERFLDAKDLELLVAGKLADPHRVLGIISEDHQDHIVLFRPGADVIALEVLGDTLYAKKHHSGIFSCSVSKKILPHEYRIYHQNGLLTHDPYAFPVVWGEYDSHLFHQGTHYQIYNRMGAIPCTVGGIAGVLFSVWAPNAIRVSVVGDFNFWNGLVNPLRKVSVCGVWELFVPGIAPGEKYKWEILTKEGAVIVKTDPYGKSFEFPSQGAAIVVDPDRFSWTDTDWLQKRQKMLKSPLSIYEVHIGSWIWENNRPLNYRDLATKLAEYCHKMHYTHVELLPITEHPLNESWGYQTTGYYAPTCRYGSVEDFQFLVNYLHNHDIGVILDWVPGHFPTDHFALAAFDGSPIYENANDLHPHWYTHIFNYRCNEVANFLIGSALFWIDKMHIDGLRFDAVASMLYLDYGRSDGMWTPNIYGGNENLDAIEFIRHCNSVIHREFPGVLTFAEESTAFPKVTYSVSEGGLGFDYKWNLGWMHDILRYLRRDPIFRCHHQQDLTFSLWYAFNERSVLPLSHDEVVHGKGCLLDKMHGSMSEKFAYLRLLFSYQLCQPGKKLLFMGGEIAQPREWSTERPLEWAVLNDANHKNLQTCVSEINQCYQRFPQLWNDDPESFLWVDFSDSDNSVIAYYRLDKNNPESALLCIHHFSSMYFPSYSLRCQNVVDCSLIFNSDAKEFGGSGQGFRKPHINNELGVLDIELPPISTLIYSVKLDFSLSI
ncbi:1,4-alpha-glucan branching enzyme [Chlamydia ibidis]|uniref:1,4-alpha-glucan branching enzyme GlgB n=2 Tax=Chlamydia ibidis TaxID=1405396 RepID=S7J5S3_9CHLA|nr:1,4-alpha-glucan branching protein GlgB [Chlamydia ibidis]EPP35447.1 1,4-alpha-glucan branching enzyme [Chlamydia ibidis]EQM63231.1 1,4-alpha-glucan branching enzyme [Chlamydia ibidis 10-1398/6]